MRLSTGQMATQQRRSRISIPPDWVREWTGTHARSQILNGIPLTLTSGTCATFVAAQIDGAGGLDAGQFERQTLNAYQAIRAALASSPHSHPVRFWNYLPAIHETMGDGLDRYMVFNRGRYAALRDWFGGGDALPARLPAASGVGHEEHDLVVHCLAMEHPGKAIENPRQIPAFRYSARYGPTPPCFARATRVSHPIEDATALLVAGTASIRGEQSVHINDIRHQLDETLENLRMLIDPDLACESGKPLGAFTDLRVYFVREEYRTTIEEVLHTAFESTPRMDLIRADLCRADLLVEIEGLAKWPRRENS